MTTPNLALPYIAQGQAQKEVTHNQALKLIDIVVQAAVIDRDLATPPGSPAEGDRYLVAASPTGAWAGRAGAIAAWSDGAWLFVTPRPGWLVYVVDEAAALIYDGSAWGDLGAAFATLQNLTRLGIGTTADGTNPLAAKLNKALFTARTVAEGGDGSFFFTMNKEATGDDLGFLFQSNFVTKALLGLFGSDAFRLSVSSDGVSFKDAFSADPATGVMSFPYLTRFVASLNFDQYVAANSWLKVPINTTTYNDQAAFSASTNRFTAPVAGLYEFGAAIGWKQNGSNVPTVAKAKFVKNGGGTPADLCAPIVSRPLSGVAVGGSELVLTPTVMVRLAANDTVELQQLFTALDGYIPANVTTFWGHKVG